MLVADAAQGAHEFGRRGVKSTLALNRLNDDRSHARRIDIGLEEKARYFSESSTVTSCCGTGNGTCQTSGTDGPRPFL